jgi:hypothetical protein
VQDPKIPDITQGDEAGIAILKAGEDHDRQRRVGAQTPQHATERQAIKTRHLKVRDETVGAVG